jgi:hypothetical protein
MGKGARARIYIYIFIYIYVRIISDGIAAAAVEVVEALVVARGLLCSGRMAARGAEDFVEEKRRDERGLFEGVVDGKHALVYTCGRVGVE